MRVGIPQPGHRTDARGRPQMVEKDAVSTLGTNQIATTDLAGTPSTANLPGPQETPVTPSGVSSVDPSQAPPSQGTNPLFQQAAAPEAADQGENATGIDGEQVVWEARYSLKNFT